MRLLLLFKQWYISFSAEQADVELENGKVGEGVNGSLSSVS